jgi:hypothetical protein
MRRFLLLAVLAGAIYVLVASGYLNSTYVAFGDAAFQLWGRGFLFVAMAIVGLAGFAYLIFLVVNVIVRALRLK